ncbi:M56 family metallopeptidase [Mucilaginibacter sp. PAMB04168]|uniref:M56 family metallopeptidase n=1 Tax=Mucilaginibacter sp. PAMB04168 TaxID=3138567 RepID=UPI0031F639E1
MEANLYLAVAYGCYWLLFRKQTFYTANRVYLLLSTVICFVMPVVQLGTPGRSHRALQPQQTITIISQSTHLVSKQPTIEPLITRNKAATALYTTGAILAFTLFVLKLYSLFKLIFKNTRIKHKGYTLICLNNSPAPFSFLGYLFVECNRQVEDAVLQHELVHIRQKHSWDILFTELVKIISWFNPLVYLLQNSLKALHEFEADSKASGAEQKDEYVNFLIAQAYQTSGVPFANHFSNQQLLKSRIMKLYQKRSGKLARLNYLVAIPLCAGLLCASTLAFSKDYGWIKLNLKTQKVSELMQKTSSDTSAKKLRLKVTSGGVTGITDKLEIKGKPGQTFIYTAKTLVEEDKKLLLKNYGIRVEITSALATTTSIVSPPTPPTASRQPKKPAVVAITPRVMEEVKGLPPPPDVKPVKNKSEKAMQPGTLSSAINDSKGRLISALPGLKHFVGNVFLGSSPEMQFDNMTDEYLIRPQKVYIQVNNPKMENIEPNKPIVFGDNPIYLIDGKIYTVDELERRSASISTKNKTGRLLHAEKVIYHKPNNPDDIAKYGSIAKDGIEEFVGIISSNL